MKKFYLENKHNPWFWCFIGIACILFFAMPIMSKDAGFSGDETKFQIPQGYNVLNYYKTDGQDSTCMTFENLKYYGCSFDVVTAWFNEKFHVDDIAQTRHIANSFLGWVAILFIGLIVWRMGGWRAAVMALILMFFSPRFLGHSFNNPKDIPFATGVVMAIYYTMMLFRQAPKPKWSTMIMLAFSFAFALSIRVGALILIGYMGLWGLMWVIFTTLNNRTTIKGGKKESFLSAIDWSNTFKMIGYTLGICVVGFFAGLLIWPYAWQSPIHNTIDSYHAMSQFAINIRQVYNGAFLMSNELPWYYTPKFILTTIPIAVIIGWLMFPFVGAFKKEIRMESIMLYFCCIFPVFWIVYTNANVYGGWRHSLFAYPPMVATAALGFNGLISLSEKKGKSIIQYAATALPFLLLIPCMIHTFKNHPYEYIYFNELAGGNKKQFGQCEMDYYYHSIRQGTEWILENCEPVVKADGGKTIIGSFKSDDVKYYLRGDSTRYTYKYMRFAERANADWDYAVFNITGIDPEYLRSEFFPPKNTIHTIKVDGTPICIVLKREDKNDFIGAQLKAAQKYDSAMFHFRKALQHDGSNTAVMNNMTEIYLGMNRPDSALAMCKNVFQIEPNNDMATYYAAYSNLMMGKADEAINLCNSLKQHNKTFSGAYQLLIQIYLQRQSVQAAENEIMQMIDNDLLDNQSMQYYMAIQKSKGLDERTAAKGLYNAIARSLERRGKKKEAKNYHDMAKSI